MRVRFLLASILLCGCATAEPCGVWQSSLSDQRLAQWDEFSTGELMNRAGATSSVSCNIDLAYLYLEIAMRHQHDERNSDIQTAEWLRLSATTPIRARLRSVEVEASGALVFRYTTRNIQGLPEASCLLDSSATNALCALAVGGVE